MLRTARPFGSADRSVWHYNRPTPRACSPAAVAGDAGGVHMVVSSHGKASAVCRRLLVGMLGASDNTPDLHSQYVMRVLA